MATRIKEKEKIEFEVKVAWIPENSAIEFGTKDSSLVITAIREGKSHDHMPITITHRRHSHQCRSRMGYE